MRNWLVKDARAHFSDVIDAAMKGEPQRVTRRGKGAVVVVSEEQWRKASPAKPEGSAPRSMPQPSSATDKVTERAENARRISMVRGCAWR